MTFLYRFFIALVCLGLLLWLSRYFLALPEPVLGANEKQAILTHLRGLYNGRKLSDLQPLPPGFLSLNNSLSLYVFRGDGRLLAQTHLKNPAEKNLNQMITELKRKAIFAEEVGGSRLVKALKKISGRKNPLLMQKMIFVRLSNSQHQTLAFGEGAKAGIISHHMPMPQNTKGLASPQ